MSVPFLSPLEMDAACFAGVNCQLSKAHVIGIKLEFSPHFLAVLA